MKKFNKRIGLKFRIVAPFVCTTIIFIMILGTVLIKNSTRTSKDVILEVAHVAATYAASKVDADLVPLIVEGSEGSEAYQTIYDSLSEVVANTSIVFTYTMYTDGSHAYNGVVVGAQSEVGSPVMAAYDHIAPAFRGEPVVDNTFRETEYGVLLNCYLPIFNDLGEVVGAIGCTYDATDVSKILDKNVFVVNSSITFNAIVLTILGIMITSRALKPLKITKQLLNQVATCEYDDTTIDRIPNHEIGDLIKDTLRARSITLGVIQDVNHQLGAMASGDFTDSATHDELYVGAYQDINNSIKAIRNTTRDALMQIHVGSEQVASGSQQISDAAQSLSKGASDQAASVEQLAATTEDISHHIKSAEAYASEVNSKTEQSGELMQECSTQMTELVSAMQEISTSSEEISKIIKTIEDIAFQTNILALNAAIEAARAGNAGKGFAVVADEVRNLAAKVADASKETATLIETSMQSVNRGVILVNDTSERLNVATKSSNEITEMIGKITDSAREQTISIEQISAGINQISDVVQTNSAISEQSAAASEELHGQAATLNSLVGKFKL